MFQLLTEEMGPRKLHWFMAQGTPGLPGPDELVQSQRRLRFLTTIVDTNADLMLLEEVLSKTKDRVGAQNDVFCASLSLFLEKSKNVA